MSHARLTMMSNRNPAMAQPEELIHEAQEGRMFILCDDEERENEGDLVIPAQFVTPEAINFMAKYGRGLICLALEKKHVDHLDLPMMAHQNGTRFQTAFTVSIEAREGVTTGISAADRAHTIQTAISPSATSRDIVSPGHVFPLVARDGGVLVRAGQTEGSVDYARLAGLIPAAVICEIMNEDGSMARLNDLTRFAEHHALKMGTIADLIRYRRRKETLVVREYSTHLTSAFGGDFQMHLYINKVAYAEHIALVKGDLHASDEPVLVRMHALNVLEDVLGDHSRGRGGELQASMRLIEREGRGVIVLLREAQAASLSEYLKARNSPMPSSELRDYGVGAQILNDLGVRDMFLLSNSQRTIVGLEGYGLRILKHISLPLHNEDLRP